MTKNPVVNAVYAAVYIILVVLIMSNLPSAPEPKGSILVPMAMLSLFVLSAAVMAFLFVLEPAQIYLDGKKKAAIDFFLKTLGSFAAITVAFFVILFIFTR